eukprot:gene29157-30910_t
MPSAPPSSKRPYRPDHCSDYVMWPYEAHNEDGAPANFGNMYLTNVTFGTTSFWGLVYPGDLVTGAF